MRSLPSAVVDGAHPQLALNEDVIQLIGPPPRYIEAAAKRELAEIERSRRLNFGDAPPVAIEGRVVIVVDDGIATGASMKAALRRVRRNGPRRLILAAPVALQAGSDSGADRVPWAAPARHSADGRNRSPHDPTAPS